ncbi:protein Niban 1a [Myripristis murdjan]|uniref:protein Niban 1a n=1 Tax=Myripristis murdjan TaxID=586833 RepID=UPI001175DA8A|nr:protein Niban [Myripristis murdjan]
MGISASSLLDETKSNYIKGQAEAELKQFSPYYRKQFSVAHFSQVEDDLEQQKEKITQLLKQREGPEEGEVLYEDAVLYFDDTRKWRERYVVVRANYCLECHDSLESFVKGVPPRHKLLPTGGTVLTTDEKYMAMVDKCFPDDTNNVKEEFAPSLSGMPGQFPVYLRLPYRRDSYFCFRQEAKQAAFMSILSDCIRHQNQDFLKKKTCEVQAFLKGIQLYRQDKGKYEAWDMLIGSDVRVMANLVMEQLLPSLEKDLLPRLKAKKTEKKRVWFATVEAAYILVQEHLLEGLSALKEECRTLARQQEVLIHSDMDQICSARGSLEDKLRAGISGPAEKLCSDTVQPYLASVLEELMEPISSGFQDGRQLSDSMMDQVCQDYQGGGVNEDLKKALTNMSRPNLLSCYQQIASLQEKLHNLQERFGFSNITSLIHSAQIDLQQLMENAGCTFEQLVYTAIENNPDNTASAIEKAKHRVLKQYDYDSSTVRKRIFQEALVAITLPHIKKNLAQVSKTELQGLDQAIYADHANFIHVENVYEDILLQTLDKEVTKVVKEAASLKKYNLFTDSRDILSQSSRSSLSSPSASTPGSPARVLASPILSSPEPQPPSPLVVNGLSPAAQETSSTTVEEQQEKEQDALPDKAEADGTAAATPVETSVETPLVKETEATPSVTVTQQAEAPAPAADDSAIQTVVAGEDPLETVAMEDAATPAETDKDDSAEAPETVTEEEATETEKVETAAVPETQSTDTPNSVEIALSETPLAVESIEVKTEAQEPVAQTEAPVESPDAALPAAEPANTQAPVDTLAEGIASLTVTTTEGDAASDTQDDSSNINLEAPSSGEEPVLAPRDVSLVVDAEQVNKSGPSSLNVSVGSESVPSDVESVEEAKVAQSSEDEVSPTSDLVEGEVHASETPMSSDVPAEETPETNTVTPSNDPALEAQTGVVSSDVSVSGDAEAGASVNEPAEEGSDTTTSASAEPAEEASPPTPEARAPDCVKEIRDLVVEVIEVEELVQRYPSGIPKDD